MTFCTFKSLRLLILFLIIIFLVILLLNVRGLRYVQVDHPAGEKSNLPNKVALNMKNTPSTNLKEETISGKIHKEMEIENLRSHTTKVNLKANSKTSKKTMLFQSAHQESCLKKYIFDVQALFTDPQTALELVYKNVSQAYMFTLFHRVTEVFNVKTCIIEPSILHCLLPTKYQELLAKRNFSLSNLTGSQHILTFGVIGDDVPILQKEETLQEFRNSGLQSYFVQVPLAPWMKADPVRFKNDTYTSHVFYMFYTWTIHVVVFYRRNNYLWHAALKLDDNMRFFPNNNLLYVKHDSAYENFSFHSILNKRSGLSSIYIPSSPHYFLFQIPSSCFLECNSSRAIYIRDRTDTLNSNSSLQFKNKTLTALRELKILFQNVLMNFWIFAGTLLGWYRQCDIIPYTTDVDFGAWASEIDHLNSIIKYFRANKKLHIVEIMGVLEEALEFQLRSSGLRVDLFFMYKIDNGTWASGHRPSKGYYFRYHYPFFSLCSAELLNEKVQVPCEAEDLILIEYGKQWMQPVASWNYESSIHNRGPNIYWDEKRRPKSFQNY